MARVYNNDNDEAVNSYIAMREAIIARNQKRLRDLGLLKPPQLPKQKAVAKMPQQGCEQVRRSSRLSSRVNQPYYKEKKTYRTAEKRTCDTDPEGASSDRPGGNFDNLEDVDIHQNVCVRFKAGVEGGRGGDDATNIIGAAAGVEEGGGERFGTSTWL